MKVIKIEKDVILGGGGRNSVKKMVDKVRMGYVLVSNWEAAMLKRLRKYDFGTWTVIKTDGQPRRIVEGGSSLLDGDEADELFEG